MRVRRCGRMTVNLDSAGPSDDGRGDVLIHEAYSNQRTTRSRRNDYAAASPHETLAEVDRLGPMPRA